MSFSPHDFTEKLLEQQQQIGLLQLELKQIMRRRIQSGRIVIEAWQDNPLGSSVLINRNLPEAIVSATVRFSVEFQSKPTIAIGISGVDVKTSSGGWDGYHPKIRVSTENISVEGFECMLRTWGNCKDWHGLTVDWVAYSE